MSAAAGLSGPFKKRHLPYHQVEHPKWAVGRLHEVYRTYGFSLERSCILSLSVGPHDLEQLTPGLPDDGIGWNEWKSAAEAREILLGAGFEAEREFHRGRAWGWWCERRAWRRQQCRAWRRQQCRFRRWEWGDYGPSCFRRREWRGHGPSRDHGRGGVHGRRRR